MALFRKFFYRKPPDGLLEISERVYVFDSCFTTDVLEEDEYKVYMEGIVSQLRDQFPDASFVVFNFREGQSQSQISAILSEFDMTVMEYPRQYEGCPLLTMEMVHHFLRSGESWLSLGQQNVLLMHCERGGWPVLAFMLAALLVYRKQYAGEQRTLDMIYKQAPRELLQLLSPLNPLPSQLRYLHYISRRNVGLEWPPLDRALTLDCVILRFVPDFDSTGGCRPLFRIYGQDPFLAADRTPRVLFSMPKRSKLVRFYKQDCELVKIDIHCHIQGDVVLECISLDEDQEREQMMFRVMFNTAFIRSNILMLDRDSIDILWDAKDRFPKDFRVEVLLSEMDAANSLVSLELISGEEKEGLPIEAFAKVKEIFNNLDWLDTKADAATKVFQQIASSKSLQENMDVVSPQKSEADFFLTKSCQAELQEEDISAETDDRDKKSPSASPKKQPVPFNQVSDSNTKKNSAFHDLMIQTKRPSHTKIISQRLPASRSTPALSSNYRSHATGSRYHSAPSTLGIMALLDDHAACSRTEATQPTKITSSLTTSSSSGSTISPKSSQHLLSIPVSLTSPNYYKETSFIAASSSSVSTSPKPPQHLLPELSSTSSATYTKETSQQPAHIPAKETSFVAASSSYVSTISLKPPQHLLPVLSSTSSATYTQETSQQPAHIPGKETSIIAASSSSVSTILPKPPQHLLPVLSSTSSATYTKETSQQPAHIPISSPPSSPPSPLAPKEASSARASAAAAAAPPPPPPPPPPSPPASANKSEIDTICKPPESFKSPFQIIKSSIAEVPPSPAQKLLDLVQQTLIPTLPLHHSTSTQSTSVPSPPSPPCKRIALPPTSTGLEKPAFRDENEVFSGYTVPGPPPPPLMTLMSPLTSLLPLRKEPDAAVIPPPPPPPPCPDPHPAPAAATSAPPPPPPPHIPSKHSGDFTPKSSSSPSVPPPPAPPGPPKGATSGNTSGGKGANCEVIPPPPPGGMIGGKGRLLGRTSRLQSNQASAKRANLKPLHWVKVTRAVQGSLWAESQNCDEFSKAPEFDMSELESLFSAAMPTPDLRGAGSKSGRSIGSKSDKVHLIDLRRANNCEIMLTKVKMPLNDLMSAVLTLDDSILDVDQIDNLIKFCPTKEEMELLKGYNGDKENLGKCEQYFLELMKVPRVECKLRVFSFKIQFRSQVAELKQNLNIVNSSAAEIRSSIKLKRIMQTILSLGNALNQGTARGSAVGFRLDSLLKLTDTRARNNKMTLMHYLCKVLAEKLPKLLDFPKDLVSLELAAKMQLKILAEEMQAVNKGLEKVEQELTTSENDGHVSQVFCEILKDFLAGGEAEVRSLTLLYSNVGRNADALALYFGEDPARCPFEQVVSTLLNFVKMFVRAHEENCKQLELEKKKALKEAEHEKTKTSSAKKEP